MAIEMPVVDLREAEPGIMLITMQDREHKNTFTDALIRELTSAFQRIEEYPGCKAVILTGYDSFFSSGGTQESLLGLHDGALSFNDHQFYSLPLQCKVPVIAAMQGHGIGGGFVLGLFADFVILSRESVYATNFMKYGFTPGMGATLICAEKLGFALAEEMLLTADTYRGADLAKRGISIPVLPREEVLEQAFETARRLADKPRISLITLKEHLAGPLRKRLVKVVEQELAMHRITFHQPEVKERIMKLFGK